MIRVTERENYLRVWHYSPGTGRFLSSDPIGFGGDGENLYIYVNNQPFNYTDPYGLYSFDEFLTDYGNFSSGFADMLTSGFGLSYLAGLPSLTEYYRKSAGLEGHVNKCNGFYSAGEYAADAWLAVTLGGAAGKVRIEKNKFKLAGELVDKWHIHAGRTKELSRYHLPFEGKQWFNNLKSIIRRRMGK